MFTRLRIHPYTYAYVNVCRYLGNEELARTRRRGTQVCNHVIGTGTHVRLCRPIYLCGTTNKRVRDNFRRIGRFHQKRINRNIGKSINSCVHFETESRQFDFDREPSHKFFQKRSNLKSWLDVEVATNDGYTRSIGTIFKGDPSRYSISIGIRRNITRTYLVSESIISFQRTRTFISFEIDSDGGNHVNIMVDASRWFIADYPHYL